MALTLWFTSQLGALGELWGNRAGVPLPYEREGGWDSDGIVVIETGTCLLSSKATVGPPYLTCDAAGPSKLTAITSGRRQRSRHTWGSW